ncbi:MULTISPECIES: hypothetical protein [Pseudomonas]|uniref:Uncharacterized protein n=1 Tax=Pseudomonas fluorescens TaxID=294 RepID=A0A166QLX9_PSEFL|nr:MULTISPECIES: hypothetical protein [Pseudomonas]KZN20490.1 hypothetical protein A1D17_02820 [Pseudomonas fluorescens]
MSKQNPPLTRTIRSGFDDETVEIDTYQEIHWPNHQHKVGAGYPLNPELRRWFDQTPNEARESLETKHWWGLPFIRTDTWEAMEKHRREVQASHRQEQNEFVKSDEQLEADIAKDKAQWFATWPTGTRYEVRCLDGGAWDRSTGWGMVGSLEEAIDICKNGPSWRH